MKRSSSFLLRLRNYCCVIVFSLLYIGETLGQEVIPDDLKLTRSNRVRESEDYSSSHLMSAIVLNEDIRVFQECMDGDYYFVLKLNHKRSGMTIDKTWSLTVNFTVSLGATELWTSDLSIDPQVHKPTATAFFDQTMFCEDGYDIRVNSLTWVNEPSQEVKADIELAFMLYKKPEYESIETAVPPAGPSVQTDFQTGLFTITIPDHVDDAVAYELEWVFANSTYFRGLGPNWDANIFNLKEPINIELSVDDPTYEIYAFYGLGHIFFRYRALGYHPDNPEYLIKSEFSPVTDVLATDFDNGPDALGDFSFDPESPVFHNWQKVTTYAEGGKSKTVISVMDGTLRNRQTITNLNSQGVRMIAESMYDYEGRPVVNVLPAPVDLTSRFYPNFNAFSGSMGKYAYDNGRAQPNNLMDETLGAAKYYSNNNTIHLDVDHAPLSLYIPDSEGQPYAQTAYMNDNSGRPSRQGGVGPTFNVDGTKATRYFYAGAANEELERLFGSQVGNALHYKKNMVVDPNGQASVSYLDQEGRVVATALAGLGAGNLQKLPSNAEAQGTITINLIDQNFQTSDDEKVIEYEFLNQEPNGSYDFIYQLDATSSEVQITGSSIYDEFPCSDCFYDVRLSLTGPEGESVPLIIDASGTDPEAAMDIDGNDIVVSNFHVGECSNQLLDIAFSAVLTEQGNHKITKSVSLSALDYEEVRTIIESESETSIIISNIESYFQVDYTECNISNDLSLLDDDDWEGYEGIIGEVTCAEYTNACAIAYCEQNRESKIWEIEASMVQSWGEAGDKGFDEIVKADPYFSNEGLSGFDKKRDIITRLNNIEITYDKTGSCEGTTVYTGSIWEITDPDNIDFFINECGEQDANGFHMLYMELLKPDYTPDFSLPEGVTYTEAKRWRMFRSFYLREKREVEYEIALEIEPSCTELLTSLEPVEEDLGITGSDATIDDDWTTSHEWGDLFGSDDLVDLNESSVANSLFDYCGITNSTAEFNTIIGYVVNKNSGAINTFFADKGCEIPSTYLDFLADWSIETIGECLEIAVDYPCPSFSAKWYVANGYFPCCDDPCDFSCNVFAIAPPQGVTASSSTGSSSTGAGGAESCCTVWVVEDCAPGRPPGETTGPLSTCQKRVSYQVPCNEVGDYYTSLITPPLDVWLDQGELIYEIVPSFDVEPVWPDVFNDFFTLTFDQPSDVGIEFTGATTCLQYDFNYPDFAQEFDFAHYYEECTTTLIEQNQDEIDIAIEVYYREQATRYMTHYKEVCINQDEALTAEYETGEYHHTLYYYDQAGNLVQTVPPAGVDLVSQDHTLNTRYKYNSLNQLTWQNTPDAGTTQFYYDSKSQLRLSQNAEQAPHTDQLVNKYSYTKYDALGRIVEVGEIADGDAIVDPSDRALLNDPTFPDESLFDLVDITRTYYDRPADLSDLTLPEPFEQENIRNRVSWTQVIKDEMLESGEVETPGTATYYSYDIHGNVKALLQHVPELDPKRVDYIYDLVSGNVNYVFYQYGTEEQFVHHYVYDDDNRLQSASTSVDGFTWEREAEYLYYPHGPLARIKVGQDGVQGIDYYYTLQGWLKGINAPGGGDPMGDGTATMYAKDEFALAIGYFDGDYSAVGGYTNPGVRDGLWDQYGNFINDQGGLYNGNIAWMDKQIPEAGRQQDDDELAGMEATLYDYDQLNRIMASRGLTSYDGTYSRTGTASDLKALDTDYSYDPNGNLMSLDRRGIYNEEAGAYTYTYTPGKNRLESVDADYVGQAVNPSAENLSSVTYQSVALSESVSSTESAEVLAIGEITLSPGFSYEATGTDSFSAELVDTEASQASDGGVEAAGHFRYDEIGNLIEQNDGNSGILSAIDWTVYGKVRGVAADGNAADYRYDAAGNRVSKSVTGTAEDLSTYYIRDASGNTLATYVKKGSETVELSGMSIYGSSRIGRYIGGVGVGERVLGKRYYELTNHLGNVMAVVSDDISREAGATRADVVSTSDYYPFGLGYHEYYNDREDRNEAEASRYGFNGKERDKSMGASLNYDYGARIYSPSIGRFLSTDPLQEKYPFVSPYNYTFNNPIRFIDPDGRYVRGNKTTSLSAFLKVLSAWGVAASKTEYREVHRIPDPLNPGLSRKGLESENHAKLRIFAHDITAPVQIVNEIGSYKKNFGSYLDIGLPLDVKHFVNYASLAYTLPDGIVKKGSIHREYKQALDGREDGRTSAFSPEDVFSNYLGVYFGGSLGNANFGVELEVFLKEAKTLFSTGTLEGGKYLTADRIAELKGLALELYGTEDLTHFTKNSDIYKLENVQKINDESEARIGPVYKKELQFEWKLDPIGDYKGGSTETNDTKDTPTKEPGG